LEMPTFCFPFTNCGWAPILYAATAGISDDQRITLSLTAESLPGAFVITP
jgi:hypothetical protein